MFCASCGKSIPDGSGFCPGCGKPAGWTPSQKKTNPLEVLWKIFAAVVIVFGALFFFAMFNTKKPVNSKTPIGALVGIPQPVTAKIFSGDVTIGAGKYHSWTLTIPPDMGNAELVGSFHASGGFGNDIVAVVAAPDEFENWINGHQARVFYSTDKTTTGKMDLHLAPGAYIIAFCNRFSLLLPKTVNADLELRYSK